MKDVGCIAYKYFTIGYNIYTISSLSLKKSLTVPKSSCMIFILFLAKGFNSYGVYFRITPHNTQITSL